MATFTEYHLYDGLGLAELVRTKQVKACELVEEAVSRIEELNPGLNAVIFKMYERARELAAGDLPDGPFTGVPFLLKDLGAPCAGVPMCNGSRFHRGSIMDHDCEMVKRFKAAGLNLVGLTNTPEYGLSPVTEPELFGPTRNPWDPARTPGGSSGGSAAAVAACLVPLAHGSDGGGSIRTPASSCGLFGLKPTRGRTPLGPDVGEGWHGLGLHHVLTRSVRDSAAMLDATAGPDVGAPYFAPPVPFRFLDQVTAHPGRLRIAVSAQPLFPSGPVHADCLRALESTAQLCGELGHEVMDVPLQIESQAVAVAFLTVMCASTRADIEEAEVMLDRKASSEDFERVTWGLALLAEKIRSFELSTAIRLLQNSARQIGRYFEQCDVLLTPTLPRPPVLVGAPRFNKGTETEALEMGFEGLAEQMFEFTPYTPVFNYTGQPAMSVPLFWNDEGLPIGMQFVGRYGDEATLFRLAGQLEAARPWFSRLPSMCAGGVQATGNVQPW